MDQSELIYNYEVTNSLSHAISSGEHGLGNVPGLLKKIIKGNHWQMRLITQTKREVEFKRFAEFVTAKPLEGLGTNRDTLQRICEAAEDTEALDLLQQAFDDKPGRPPKGETKADISLYYNDISATQGTTAEYALRRLRKDRPDLHAQVIEKKLSPHAAMVEAGFRPKTITVPVDVEKAAKALVRSFGEDAPKLIEAIQIAILDSEMHS